VEEGEKEGLWERVAKSKYILEKIKIKPRSVGSGIKVIKLSQDEMETIKDVMEKYGKQTEAQLSILSHKLPAWRYSSPYEIMHIAELSIED